MRTELLGCNHRYLSTTLRPAIGAADSWLVGALLDDARLLTWGGNQYGQLAHADTEPRATPALVLVPSSSSTPASPTSDASSPCSDASEDEHDDSVEDFQLDQPLRVSTAAAGLWHLLVVQADASAPSRDVYGCGWNRYAQLGLDRESRVYAHLTRQLVALASDARCQVRVVACGARHSLVLDDASLWAYGSNQFGQLPGEPVVAADADHDSALAAVHRRAAPDIVAIGSAGWLSVLVSVARSSSSSSSTLTMLD